MSPLNTQLFIQSTDVNYVDIANRIIADYLKSKDVSLPITRVSSEEILIPGSLQPYDAATNLIVRITLTCAGHPSIVQDMDFYWTNQDSDLEPAIQKFIDEYVIAHIQPSGGALTLKLDEDVAEELSEDMSLIGLTPDASGTLSVSTIDEETDFQKYVEDNPLQVVLLSLGNARFQRREGRPGMEVLDITTCNWTWHPIESFLNWFRQVK